MLIEQEGKVEPFIYSYSGHRLGFDYPAITIEDLAIALGRISRFGGHSVRMHSVLIHSMTVADLVPDDCKGVALLHDAVEGVLGGDTPTPFKTEEMRAFEAKMLDKIFSERLSEETYKEYKSDANIWKIVKIADTEAFLGELHVLGNISLRQMFPDRSREAETAVRGYLDKYTVDDCIRADGRAVLDFISKFKDYR